MICKHCGAQLAEGSQTCSSCGRELASEVSQDLNQAQVPQSAMEQPEPKVQPMRLGIFRFRTIERILLLLSMVGLVGMPLFNATEVNYDANSVDVYGIYVLLLSVSPGMKFNFMYFLTGICTFVSFIMLFRKKSSLTPSIITALGAVFLIVFGLTCKKYIASIAIAAGYLDPSVTVYDDQVLYKYSAELVHVKMLIGFYISIFSQLAAAIMCFLDRKVIKIKRGTYINIYE